MKFLGFDFLKQSGESTTEKVKTEVKKRKGKRLNYTRPTKKVIEEPIPVSTPMEESKTETKRTSLRERYS